MSPPADCRVAPRMLMPLLVFDWPATPWAKPVAGSTPPDRVILPPLLLIDEPGFRKMAPPPMASASLFSMTLSLLLVEEMLTPSLMTMSLWAIRESVASPPAVLAMLAATVMLLPAVAVGTVTFVPVLSVGTMPEYTMPVRLGLLNLMP